MRVTGLSPGGHLFPRMFRDTKLTAHRLRKELAQRCHLPFHAEAPFASVVPRKKAFLKTSHVLCLVHGRSRDGRIRKGTMLIKSHSRAAAEYSNLSLLWSRYFAGDDVNCIPRPVCFWPEDRLMITERLDGQVSLLTWLVQYASPLGRLMDQRVVIARAWAIADWLVSFQERTNAIEGVPILSDVDEATRNICGMPGIPAHVQNDITKRLSRIRTVVERTRPVLSHGSFTARNVLLRSHSVTVVNWEKPLVMRHPLYDVHTFLADLENQGSYLFCSRERLDDVREAFLSRYLARTSIGIDSASLAAIRVIVMIDQLRSQQQAAHSHPLEVFVKRRQAIIWHLVAEINREVGTWLT